VERPLPTAARLIKGDQPTGRFPGAGDPEFVAWCREFLVFQITTMRPSVVATIGADARRFLSRLSRDLASWRNAPSMTVAEAEIAGHRFSAVSLAHPSMYPASARRRQFDGAQGIDADAAIRRFPSERRRVPGQVSAAKVGDEPPMVDSERPRIMGACSARMSWSLGERRSAVMACGRSRP
jgi:hypothetical protein